jgi:hypothetical protein
MTKCIGRGKHPPDHPQTKALASLRRDPEIVGNDAVRGSYTRYLAG